MLTDTEVRRAKPGEKPRLYDSDGMYLEVTPRGGKYWRLKYRFAGKEKRLALGVYPGVTLKNARERRDEARRLLREGIDPSLHRKATKHAVAERSANSFEAIAREWFAKFAPSWVESHSSKVLQRLEKNVLPWLGDRPIAEIRAPEVLAVLRRIENRGPIETAHRSLQDCARIFRYAVATGRAETDPTGALKGALRPHRGNHFASIQEPARIAELLRAMDGYSGDLPTLCALRLAPLVFLRPGELRQAEWAHLDLDAGEWRIPYRGMKERIAHVVPLPNQAVSALRELRPLTGAGRYVFPGVRDRNRPMSENTVNAALHRLGFKGVMTGHGFRAMACTLLKEQGWSDAAVERQLAHKIDNKTTAAYDYSKHLPERRRMLQQWANYLDSLRRGTKVVSLHAHSKELPGG